MYVHVPVPIEGPRCMYVCTCTCAHRGSQVYVCMYVPVPIEGPRCMYVCMYLYP